MITYKNRYKVSSRNKGYRAYHYHGNIHAIYLYGQEANG